MWGFRLDIRLEMGETEGMDNYTDASVGKKVQKVSGKPFKSTFQQNTVKYATVNPHTNKIAFGFEEDDSIVDIEQIELVKEKE